MSGTANLSVLIIGATGLLGRGIVRELSRVGWNVVLLSRGKLASPEDLSGHEHLIADRSQKTALKKSLGERRFDAVVDCAAYSRDDAQSAIEIFSGATSHYFFISTDFVYSSDPAARYPIGEEASKLHSSAYPAGKLDAEAALMQAARQDHFPVTILRPPHILGAGRPAGCDPAAGGRDASLTSRLLAGKEIPLLAGGLFLIQPVWSREIGKAIVTLAGMSHTFGQTFNIAGVECITTRRYYEIIAGQIGVTLKVKPVDPNAFCLAHPDKAHFARHRIYDCRNLESAGFKPSLALNDAMAETLKAQGA
jgi:nucleoside-diphosphate-sugar epimerase